MTRADSRGSLRAEHDSMGEIAVPAAAYYGASTQRAVENFPISALRLPRRLIAALGRVKAAAAQTNAELGLLDPAVADAIEGAAREMIDGRWDQEFVVDVFQTGSGTSSNMNANEVIANRALELLGAPRGARDRVHPNDHVNRGQSSNDVFPTAIQLAALDGVRHDLLPALTELEAALIDRRDAFWPIIKTGRTHLQDATPIRLGQEFSGYAAQVARARGLVTAAAEHLEELPLGGTAVGTGIGRHPEFAAGTIARLRSACGAPGLRETDNHFQAQASLDVVVAAAGALRVTALALHKIATDIRLLGCGPRAGIAELELPEVQPGSSIMPGKVNPVIIESLCMVVAQVIGNDATISFAAATGSLLELNVMLPVAGHSLIESIELLSRATVNFARRCVGGLRASTRGPDLLDQGLALCTGLVPAIGYDAAAAIAHAAHRSGRTVREVAREQTRLDDAALDRLLDPERLVEPGFEGTAGG